MDFRPHTLIATIPGGESVWNEAAGRYETPASTAVTFPCRVSPNGKGAEVITEDGTRVVFAFLLHADADVTALPYGAEVKVFQPDGETIKAKGKVLGFFQNSMNTRIWI